jgi:hypothetical protein
MIPRITVTGSDDDSPEESLDEPRMKVKIKSF